MGEELLTLGMETATERRSVAVMRGRALLSLRASELRDGGGAGVLPDIDAALREACVALRELELLAVGVGPGSFTGLRAGLATLKALAVTLNKPCVGIPTLHAVAYGSRPAERVVALLPAGRGEVFAQLLSVTREGSIEELEAPRHVAPALLVERLAREGAGGLKWAGGGAFRHLDLIEEAARRHGFLFSSAQEEGEDAAHGTWMLAPAQETLAESVSLLAQAKYARGEAEGADELRAVYVRPSDAELKEQWHAQG